MDEAIVVLILSVVSFIVWLVRLEGRINYNERNLNGTNADVEKLKIKVENIDSDLVRELTEIKITLAKIDGFLAMYKKEMEK